MKTKDFSLIAKIISHKADIELLENKQRQWAADMTGKRIFYPAGIKFNDIDFGILLHEIGHIKYSLFGDEITDKTDKLAIKYGKASFQIWRLLNALEDLRIENKLKDLFAGSEKFLELAIKDTFAKTLINLQALDYMPEKRKKLLKDQANIFCGTLCWLGHSKAYGNRYIKGLYGFDPSEYKLYRAIKKAAKFLPEVKSCANTLDLVKLMADKILPLYLPFCDKANKMPIDFFKELINAFIKIISKHKKQGKTKIKAGNIQKLSNVELDKKDKKIIGNKILSAGFKISDKISSENKENDYTGFITCNELENKINSYLPKVKKAISIIKDINFRRYAGNYESGKLKAKRIYKLYTGHKNIFAKRIAENQDKDIAFALIIDESGSMNNTTENIDAYTKSQLSSILASLLGKALTMAGRPFAIYGFSNEVIRHKPFNKKFNLASCLEIDRNTVLQGHNTNEARAIELAAKDLAEMPNKNKVAIVINDGQPDNKPLLKKAISQAEKHKINFYAIGINSDSVKEFYKNSITVFDITGFTDQFINILRKLAGKRLR